MKRTLSLPTLTLSTIALLALTAPVFAQETPGAHFVENFDMNGDGQVTLAEVQEKRGEIFYMFDQDEDGTLTGEEYDMFDETRAADHENMEQGNGGNGNGGNGTGGNGNGGNGNGGNGGNGNGGQGRGHGNSGANQGEGMSREMTDINGDGLVTEAEFLEATATWFERKDRNNDGVITPEDFGPRG